MTSDTVSDNAPDTTSISLTDKIFSPKVLDIAVSKESASNKVDLPIITAIPSVHNQRSFMKYLAQNGELNCAGFSGRIVEQAAKNGTIPAGFSVQYILPPQNNKESNYHDNFCLMEDSVVPLWQKMTPLLTGLNDVQPIPHRRRNTSTKRGDFVLPKLPYVMRVRDFKNTQALVHKKLHLRHINCQSNPSFEIVSSKLRIYPLPQGLLLYRNGLSALTRESNLHLMVLEIHLPSTAERQQIKKEYISNKQILIKQLALEGKIPSLSLEQQEKAIESGTLPDNYPYSCHHVLPRILGGTNDPANLYYISNPIHRRLHKFIRDYEKYLDLAPTSVRYARLFVVLPMPADYTGEALRFIHSKESILTAHEFSLLKSQKTLEEEKKVHTNPQSKTPDFTSLPKQVTSKKPSKQRQITIQVFIDRINAVHIRT